MKWSERVAEVREALRRMTSHESNREHHAWRLYEHTPALLTRLARLEEALAFYRDGFKYEVHPADDEGRMGCTLTLMEELVQDMGRCARAALRDEEDWPDDKTIRLGERIAQESGWTSLEDVKRELRDEEDADGPDA